MIPETRLGTSVARAAQLSGRELQASKQGSCKESGSMGKPHSKRCVARASALRVHEQQRDRDALLRFCKPL